MSLVPGAHVDTLTMEAYAAQLVDADAESAIERHLLDCEVCRTRMAAAADGRVLPGAEPIRLQRIWDAVVDVIDTPPRSMPTPAGLRARAHWRRRRQFLAICPLPAGRLAPLTRRALVSLIALLAVPVAIIVSGSLALSAHDPFDTMNPVNAGGTIVAPQRVCAATDLAVTVDRTSGGPGQGTLMVSNVSGTVCVLPTAFRVEPMGSTDDQVRPALRPASTGLSEYQAYHLYPSRPALRAALVGRTESQAL